MDHMMKILHDMTNYFQDYKKFFRKYIVKNVIQ